VQLSAQTSLSADQLERIEQLEQLNASQLNSSKLQKEILVDRVGDLESSLKRANDVIASIGELAHDYISKGSKRERDGERSEEMGNVTGAGTGKKMLKRRLPELLSVQVVSLEDPSLVLAHYASIQQCEQYSGLPYTTIEQACEAATRSGKPGQLEGLGWRFGDVVDPHPKRQYSQYSLSELKTVSAPFSSAVPLGIASFDPELFADGSPPLQAATTFPAKVTTYGGYGGRRRRIMHGPEPGEGPGQDLAVVRVLYDKDEYESSDDEPRDGESGGSDDNEGGKS